MTLFQVFVIFLLKFFGMKARLGKPGTSSLREFLHASSNITYFEPVNYDKDSILRQHKAAVQNPADNVVIIELNAFKRHFSLILRQDTNLFSQGPRVKIKSKKKDNNFEFKFNEYYTGKVSGDQNSSVTGRIRTDGTLDGCFYTAGTLYHLEPASRYFTHPLPFHSLLYQSHDVEFDSSVRIAAKKVHHSYRKLHQLPKTMSFQTSHRRARAVRLSDNSTDINTCTLHIAADHHFYNHVGKGSVDETIAEMVFHIAGSDKIFRSTDFNGDGGPGDNIGFRITAITLFQDAEAEGILGKPPASFQDFLAKWSTFNHDRYCLALLFTYLSFPKGTLGLAWVGATDIGGICSKRVLLEDSKLGEMNFNSGAVTFKNANRRIPRKASLITVAHELGHSFGSEHDPRTKLCTPNENGGNYIMYTYSTNGREPNNYLFSECSKSQMWPIIFNKGPKCFIADNQGANCGNKIVEEGEECDCGLQHECHLIDKCCEPRNKSLEVSGCRLKDGNQCSLRKGPCCTQDCMVVTTPNTICKQETQCTYKAFCNYNATCPSAVSKPLNTTCNHGSNTCVDGECTGSICTLYGLQECQCSSHHLTCHVCCNDTKEGCISASTIVGRQVVLRPAGSTCNQDTGYCDQHGYCITVNTDSQLRVLKEAFERTTSKASVNDTLLWLGRNWYYLVALIAGACFVAMWLKFAPCRNNPLGRILGRFAIHPYHHNMSHHTTVNQPDQSHTTVNQRLPQEHHDSNQTASTSV